MAHSELYQNAYLLATVFFVTVCFFVVLINKQYLINSAKNHLLHLNQPDYVLVLLFTFVTVLGFPIFAFLYVFFGVFQKLVGKILEFKHGDRFGGFFENMDTLWSYEVVSKNNVLMGFLIDFNGTSDEFFQNVKKQLEEKCFSGATPKLMATRHRFLGYFYLLKNDFDVNDCLTLYECEKNPNEEELQRILSNIANGDLPKKHTALWEVIVINKPVIWEGRFQKNHHFVIVKIHHSLGDGNKIYNFIFRCLGNNDDYDEPDYDLQKKQPPFLTKISKRFTIFCLMPIVNLLILLRKEDFHSELNGRKITTWHVDNGGKYFNRVKIVKKKLQKSFSEIILAAISDSYTKNITKDKPQKYVSCTMTVAPYLVKFPKLKKEDTLTINNDSMSVVIFRIPGFLEGSSMTGRLQELHKNFNAIQNTHDCEVVFWLMRLVEKCLPAFMSKIVHDCNTAPIVVSNVPGLPPTNLFGGKALEIIGYAPNHSKSGLTVTINTNDNRFQIAILADRGMVSNEEQVKNFGRGIFESLDRLYEELNLN